MPKCEVCQDAGFVYKEKDGQEVAATCKCKVSEAVKSFLPDMFAKYPIVKKGFKMEQFDKNLCYRTDLKKFGSFINTFLTHKYLTGRARDTQFTYSIVTAYAFVESFFDESSNKYYEADLLVILLYGGYKNGGSAGKLSTLLKDRELTNKNTIVFIDKAEYPDSKVKEWYGQDFLTLINTFAKIGN